MFEVIRKEAGMRESEKPPKRGVGKPPGGDDAINKCITLKASSNEIAAWRKEAAKKGLSISQFVLGPLRRYMARRKKEGK